MALVDYAWLVPALPALAAAAIALFGMRMGNKLERGGWMAVVLVALAAALSLGIFFEMWGTVTFENPRITQIEWFSTGTGSNALTVNMGIYVDPLTIFMLFTVGILVTLITLYSTGYMHDEGTGRRRYFAELTLFITGMLGLVVASNYLMLFIFWEIMGLCSYLLIGYWYHKPSAASAAKKAFLTTRVGDAFFLVGLGILLMEFKTLDFDALFRLASQPGIDRDALLLANACIFIGAVGKSAQFPLHTWLPDAMEGPTTVSALIHAATMVKAGVYLVARSYPLFVQTPELLVAVAVIGGFTALFAATMALTNWDLKRVLAYSTLSQLGYMFLGLGVAGALFWSKGQSAALTAVALTGITVAIFHLFSHAFFKAGLFLSAGSVGHAFHGAANPYDMRQMGGLRKYMPVTAFAMLMGTISIAGIPPFSGFYSKDGIVHAVYEAAHQGAGIVYWILFAMAVATAGLTAYYMFRLYFLTFEGRHRGLEWWNQKSGGAAMAAHDAGHAPDHDDHGHHAHAGPAAPPAVAAKADDHHHDAGAHHHHAKPHEGPWTMTLPLAILGVFAIFGGILALYFAHGEFSGLIHAGDAVRDAVGASAAAAAHGGLVDAIIHPFVFTTTYITLAVVLAGIALAWIWWGPGKAEANITTDAQVSGLARLWQKRYYIDDAYDRVFGYAVLRQADAQDRFDAEVIDGAVNGVATVNRKIGERTRRWNTGFVQDYALTILAGFVLIVLLVIYWRQVPIMIDRLRELF